MIITKRTTRTTAKAGVHVREQWHTIYKLFNLFPIYISSGFTRQYPETPNQMEADLVRPTNKNFKKRSQNEPASASKPQTAK